MSKQDVITAYKHVAFPEAQEQNLPGLEKDFNRMQVILVF